MPSGGNTTLLIWELATFLVLLPVFLLLFSWARRRYASDGGQGSGNTSLTAEEVLDRRYASGELTREEYLAIESDIKREQDA